MKLNNIYSSQIKLENVSPVSQEAYLLAQADDIIHQRIYEPKNVDIHSSPGTSSIITAQKGFDIFFLTHKIWNSRTHNKIGNHDVFAQVTGLFIEV